MRCIVQSNHIPSLSSESIIHIFTWFSACVSRFTHTSARANSTFRFQFGVVCVLNTTSASSSHHLCATTKINMAFFGRRAIEQTNVHIRLCVRATTTTTTTTTYRRPALLWNTWYDILASGGCMLHVYIPLLLLLLLLIAAVVARCTNVCWVSPPMVVSEWILMFAKIVLLLLLLRVPGNVATFSRARHAHRQCR